jgi:hypothetical protein
VKPAGRSHITVLVALSATLTTGGHLLAEEIDLGKVKTAIYRGDVSAVKELARLPLKEGLPHLRRHALSNDVSIAPAALAVLRQIPDIESILGAEIRAKIRTGVLSDSTVSDDFNLLAALDTPRAAREVGAFLNSSTILWSPSEDVSDETVRTNAEKSRWQQSWRSRRRKPIFAS